MSTLILAVALLQTPAESDGVVVVGDPQPQTTTRPAKPSHSISASPMMSTLDPVNGNVVTVTFILRNADERVYCAAMEWRVGEDVLGEQESDCVPFEEAEPEDLRRMVVIRQFKFIRSGIKKIRLTMKKGEKVVLWTEIEVHIK